jgi:hypothetical protein
LPKGTEVGQEIDCFEKICFALPVIAVDQVNAIVGQEFTATDIPKIL